MLAKEDNKILELTLLGDNSISNIQMSPQVFNLNYNTAKHITCT